MSKVERDQKEKDKNLKKLKDEIRDCVEKISNCGALDKESYSSIEKTAKGEKVIKGLRAVNNLSLRVFIVL